MCRIAGIISPSESNASLKQLVKGMCNVLKPGGPDDEGVYACQHHHLVLGNRRLSIIDLSYGGHQPMSFQEERYWITYNGELYNYPELRTELIGLGCSFHNHSDTEVILAAFATWGADAFRRFNGMFAFALWDAHTSELFLVRDAAGIKPLYYALTKEGLVFASEVRAFKGIPWLQAKNTTWPVFLMAYGHLPEPVTTLQEVVPLSKGTYLKYHVPTKGTMVTTFTRFSYIEKITSRDEAIDLVRTTFEAAVQRQLLADAPIGVFLSGGLDSSIIALLADRHTEKLNTVSLYFEQAPFSEKPYQDVLQKRLHCNHFQHLLREEEFHDNLPGILDTMDLPTSDGINTWFISKYARESGLKAVLSGIGSDELYGGYPSFSRMRAANFFEQLPRAVLDFGRYNPDRRLRRLVYLKIPGPVGKFLFLRGQFTPVEIAKNLGIAETQVWQLLSTSPGLPGITHLSLPNQASWVESNMYMQNQLLRDADVMSMAHGLEIRVPFLDTEFVRLSLQIASDTKYKGERKKQLLIDSFKDMLPASIWNRPKMGFAFPFKEWLLRNDFAREAMRSDKGENFNKFSKNEMHWSQYLTSVIVASHRHG